MLMIHDRELQHIEILSKVIDMLFQSTWYSGDDIEKRQVQIIDDIKALRSEMAERYYGFNAR